MFLRVLEQFPSLLRRSCWQSDLTQQNPRIAAYARAHHLGVLTNELRSDVADKLESVTLNDFDVSFFDEPQMLALIPPLKLIGMGLALRTIVLPSLEARIDEIAADADLDEEPDSHFEKLLGMLDRIEAIGIDSDTAMLIDGARDHVRYAIEALEESKREHDEGSEDQADWTHILTQKKENTQSPTSEVTKRSVFDDVDK